MKKLVGLAIAMLVLVGTLSTPSLADGGAPFPDCAPWQCTVQNPAPGK